ncbi:MAG: hypothetical protein SFV23_08345 [Planctomycetaceae bacterium]|nr:hypothetical protein [Planctomycetaceae bacterium]
MPILEFPVRAPELRSAFAESDTCESATESRPTLGDSVYPALRAVECHPIPGGVRLSGKVPTYFLKQMAQVQLRERVGQHARIENSLEVKTFTP